MKSNMPNVKLSKNKIWLGAGIFLFGLFVVGGMLAGNPHRCISVGEPVSSSYVRDITEDALGKEDLGEIDYALYINERDDGSLYYKYLFVRSEGLDKLIYGDVRHVEYLEENGRCKVVGVDVEDLKGKVILNDKVILVE